MDIGYVDMMRTLDALIDDETESGWERANEISAFDSIAEYRITQECGSTVINAAQALRGALIIQQRINGLTPERSAAHKLLRRLNYA